ncbi:ExeA family protein [Gallionella capsiferriformans]|uniref:General secretion pathway protein, ATPase n=1 Tax=Gallionella capsiferriformans (strain ES-2) TaxID=395494 RepID=D9SJ09_GALCS|nr:AAA family ATPase [Gallionella capsiferriformans]ADL54285.1 general secretion pathway protein, ATPase [Gallionella capsiferriformans ES-2]
MYLKHFGLHEAPFGLTPDTSFFFACSSYQEALNTLLVAAHNGEGFIKITGEVGNGKTMLCRKFLATLNEGMQSTTPIGTQDQAASAVAGQNFITAYIPNPYLEPRSLLLALADEFRVPLDKDSDQHQLMKGLTNALLDCARYGQRALVCLDEAQALPLPTLEVLRLLTNLETEKRKLLQVVLFGQPELNAHLAQYSIRQLRQRISFQYELRGLLPDELDRYVRHRVRVAGFAGDTLFDMAAIAKLHRVTKGTPRLVNIIAHKALMLAYGEGQQHVSARHIGVAAADTPESRRDWFALGLKAGAVIAVLLVVVSGLVLLR